MTYKVGDKVIPLIRSSNKYDSKFQSCASYNGEMDYFYNKIMTVREVRSNGNDIYVEEDKHTNRGNLLKGWVWNNTWLREVDI